MKFFHAPHLYCVTTLPSNTNTTANIGGVLFHWLNLSLDSIKMMCGYSSQVAMLDVSAAILYNSLKTSTPFIETLWEFLPLGDYRSLQLFHRLELLVVDSLLKSTPNSVIHGINIRAIWRPHVMFNEVDMPFFQIVHRGPGDVRWRSILLQCPPVMTTYCSDVRQQTLFEDDIAVVWAVNFRSRIDEDHPCLLHTRYSDRHHDVATEV